MFFILKSIVQAVLIHGFRDYSARGQLWLFPELLFCACFKVSKSADISAIFITEVHAGVFRKNHPGPEALGPPRKF